MTADRFKIESSEPILLTESSLARVIDEFLPEDATLAKPAARARNGTSEECTDLDDCTDLFASERPWRSPDFSALPAERRTVQPASRHARHWPLATIVTALAAGVLTMGGLATFATRSSVTPSPVPAERTTSEEAAPGQGCSNHVPCRWSPGAPRASRRCLCRCRRSRHP
jgi:hypothetical protein